jgi:hypothetical protein
VACCIHDDDNEAKLRHPFIKRNAIKYKEATLYNPFKILVPVVVLILTFSIYLNSLDGAFHYDDQHSIVENFALRKVENIPRFFVDPQMFSESPGHIMYRPMLLLTYAINHQLGGMKVFGFHIANNLFHALNAVLVFLITAMLIQLGAHKTMNIKQDNYSTLLYSYIPPMIAGLIFGFHTLNTQAVNYISSRSVLLVTLFYLLSFYLYMRFRNADYSLFAILCYVIAVLSYALSLLSKEIAITLPLILILYEYLFRYSPSTATKSLNSTFNRLLSTARSVLKYHMSFWGISAIYLWIRKLLLTGSPVGITVKEVKEAVEVVKGTGGVSSVYINIISQFKADVLYLKLFLLPTNLTIDKYFPRVSSVWEPEVLLAIFIIVSILAFSFWVSKKMLVISFGLIWFFIAITPETILPLNLIYNEHRTYLPIVGLSIASGAIAYRLINYRKLLLAIFIAFIAFNGIGTIKRNGIWKTPVGLWSDVVKKNPMAHGARNTLGNALAETGDYDGAMEAYKASLALAPNWERTYYNIGMTLTYKGNEEKNIRLLKEAIHYFEKALQLHPRSYKTYNAIAINYHMRREYDKALEYIKKGMKKNPNFPYLYLNLGMVLHEGYGKKEEAIEAYKKALSFDPNWDLPRDKLRELGVENK